MRWTEKSDGLDPTAGTENLKWSVNLNVYRSLPSEWSLCITSPGCEQCGLYWRQMLCPNVGTVLSVRLFFFLFFYNMDFLYSLTLPSHPPVSCFVLRFRAFVKRQREGVQDSAAALLVPPIFGNTMPTHHCVPDDIDPELVFFSRHVYDFRYGRLLKNLQ